MKKREIKVAIVRDTNEVNAQRLVSPAKAFEFRDAVRIPRMTGQRAQSLAQLRRQLATVSEECIIHHTYHYFAQGHIQEYTNDFARWAGEYLEARALAEMLSNIDPYSFDSVEGVRQALAHAIDEYAEKFPTPHKAMEGEEFYFIEATTFIFPAGMRARNLAEMLMALKYIDTSCIYYHFYEARVRLQLKSDDFSKWVDEVIGDAELAKEMQGIDPFMHTIEGIREHLTEIIEKALRRKMGATQ